MPLFLFGIIKQSFLPSMGGSQREKMDKGRLLTFTLPLPSRRERENNSTPSPAREGPRERGNKR